MHHEFPNVQDMIWVFQGDFDIIYFKGCFKCLQSNNDQVKFDLVDLSDLINGGGFFEIKRNQNGTYHFIGKLTMKASVFLVEMMKPILEKFVSQLVEQQVQEMAAKATK